MLSSLKASTPAAWHLDAKQTFQLTRKPNPPRRRVTEPDRRATAPMRSSDTPAELAPHVGAGAVSATSSLLLSIVAVGEGIGSARAPGRTSGSGLRDDITSTTAIGSSFGVRTAELALR